MKRIYSPVKFANFVYICIKRGKNNHLQLKNGYFSRVQCKYIQNLRTSQGHIFLILQQFATKLCNNFTHFKDALIGKGQSIIQHLFPAELLMNACGT